MAYFSKRHLEFLGEPLGDMSGADACRRSIYHGGGKGDSPDAPDYSKMAAASELAAKLGKELGDAQLAENVRQYDLNYAVAKPIVDEQAALMIQAKAQGDDYYDYMVKNQRPVENALNADAMMAGSEQRQNEAADRAEADTLRGFTKSANIMARQGLRYGMSPNSIKSTAGTMSTAMASNIAGASDAARNQEKNTGYAKKLDVAGLYRGLPGASQGAYSLANNAGNSAVANQNQTSAQYINGMTAGNGTIMQGQGQRISGLGSILSSQTSIASAGGGSDNTGAFIGAAGGVAAAFI